MKSFLFLVTICTLIFGCNKQPSPEAIKASPYGDSLMHKMQQKDSTILAYVSSINNIQGSIDTLMRQARIIKEHGEGASANPNIVEELRAISNQMVKNQRDLMNLEMTLKKSKQSNNELVDLGENLSKQLNEKDSEIAAIQQTLVQTKASLNNLTKQFNDSLTVINQERAQIGLMTAANNTVYYIVGTEKELKDKGIIKVEGGVVGLGRVPILSQDMTNSGFEQADLTTLHEILLGGQLTRLVTVHPSVSYKATSGSSGKIIITDPQDFWSKSKYLVAIVSK